MTGSLHGSAIHEIHHHQVYIFFLDGLLDEWNGWRFAVDNHALMAFLHQVSNDVLTEKTGTTRHHDGQSVYLRHLGPS